MRAWHKLVPKSLAENLQFRRSLLRQAEQSSLVREQLVLACAEDLLFFLSAFAWIYEPRENATSLADCRELPWVTYRFQDRCLNRMDRRWGKKPILIEKPRDMGASWMCLGKIFHRWRFRRLESYLLVSRNEDYVDKKDNPKALFQKLDFLMERLPWWLLPEFERTDMHLKNCSTGSVIDGESTTGDVARGDRRTAILLDEFAAVKDDRKAIAAARYATDCLILNSTHQSVATVFNEERERLAKVDPDAVIRLEWWEHPRKGSGAYTTKDGALKIIDETYKFPPDYPFILDGKTRSPAYDDAAERCHPQEMAREWDMNPQAAAAQFFQAHEIEPVAARDVRPPYRRGWIEYVTDPVTPTGWRDDPNGPFLLWCHLNAKGFPAQDRDYGAGGDIAAGSASASGSNSVLSIADKTTREKVLEYADPRIRPEKFAEVTMAACLFFGGSAGGAYLVFEANGGVGSNFKDRLLELGYRRVFMRRQEDKLGKPVTEAVGWWSSPKTKMSALGEYRRALLAGEFTNRSAEALSECLQYVYTANGSVEHALALNSIDPTGAKANHGDRVLADALCLMALGAFTTDVETQSAPLVPPRGSMAWRTQQADREEVTAGRW